MLDRTARCLDVGFIIAGGLIAHSMRFSASTDFGDTERLLIAFNSVLALLIFPAFGVYDTWRGKPLAAMLARVALAWMAVVAAGLLLAFTLHRMDAVSRLWFAYSTIISGALIIASKCLVYSVLRVMRSRGLNQRTVAIVGAQGFTRTLLAHLSSTPGQGFTPVCILDTSGDEALHASGIGSARTGRLPVLNDFDEFLAKVRAEDINEVWLALPLSQEHTIYRFLHALRHDFVNLRLIPDTRSMSLFNHSMTDVAGLPTINLTTSPVSAMQMWPKLLFDRCFAAAALIALAPLLIGISIAIKTTSKGPVLFTQYRKGADGRPFRIYKFRSMAMHVEHAGHVTQASRNDPRVTKVGAFIRRTSLDELPQFLNVLLGDMSVVGPRPHAIEHDDMYKDLVYGYMYRYRIKPGITGWAQVNGYRGATTKVEKMESRVKFDLFYIHNWSFWFDIKIVAITMIKGFIGRNAY
ncbi:Undecaprenyl-phosphate galactosephosphotransferase [Caballeronia glathei]|jgi:putative colanic acid biosynthesis UDP-glucose lipid carrier transferase|uniref:UDP-phosphate galactosephosphotransferase n=1 Tax=Caballeronia glathei TaxID=60547 RepID=A0A069Q218_9BURK|nr:MULTISPECIES: undecaprenyl-phosphate glucose phosphotransferase [Burkholderiaceae]KDR43826.1 UDP- phosphate galactosephosphotransferase [Caballeronia glathei]TCK43896.1 putative colanic acid biosynthesis UDP-glucose lipid carrier transferase [Paraburkholderia sp. BL8N3]CDY75624.1 Undecaprenyl-phosphate galactosephosphotransferase [Caballeronia glathei]